MLNHNNNLTNRSQQLFSVFQLTLPKTNFTKKEINSAIISVRSLSRKIKSVLNEELNFTNYYVNPNPSHNKISNQAGCVRRTTIRAEKQIEKADLLRYIRSHRKTNIIIANPIIFDFNFRIQLQKEIPALANKRMLKLCSGIRFVTPIKEKNFIYKTQQQTAIRKDNILRRKREQMSLIEKISKELNLDTYQVEALCSFPEQIVVEAYKVLLRKQRVVNKFAFLLAVCRNLSDEKKQLPRSNTINEKNNFDSISVENNHRLKQGQPIGSDNVYSVGQKPPLPPTPFYSKSYQENLNLFSDWYENHFEAYCRYQKLDKEKAKEPIKQRFIDKLDNIFRDPSSTGTLEKERRRISQTIWPSSIYI